MRRQKVPASRSPAGTCWCCWHLLLRGWLLAGRLVRRLAARLARLGRWLARFASRQIARLVALHVGRGYLGLRELKSPRVPRRLLRLLHEAAVDSFTAS